VRTVHLIMHHLPGGEVAYHYSDEVWSAGMPFAPATGAALAEEFGITPYVDWDETEDDDWLAPVRPAVRTPETEWAEAPPRPLTYDEARKRWVA
jgi:hypothetical protein